MPAERAVSAVLTNCGQFGQAMTSLDLCAHISAHSSLVYDRLRQPTHGVEIGCSRVDTHMLANWSKSIGMNACTDALAGGPFRRRRTN